MTRSFYDHNKDVDSDEQSAHRRDFIQRMSRKLEIKQSISEGR